MLPGDRQDKAEQRGSWIMASVAFVVFGGASLLSGSTATHLAGGLSFAGVVGAGVYFWASRKGRRRRKLLSQPFPPNYRHILETQVAFYKGLEDAEKQKFEQMVVLFLDETRITGIQTEIDDRLRILVAASGIIPVFNLQGFEYFNLGEILIVPGNWRMEEQKGPGVTLGYVKGFQNRQFMRLSKESLEKGFSTLNDRKNVGIHEFAHVLDDADGEIDGIPAAFIPQRLIPEWKRVSEAEIHRIRAGKSKLDSYGGTNPAEFFAVSTEYFFEHPQSLLEENPELYSLLESVYQQNPAVTVDLDLNHYFQPYGKKIGRNDPCICGSGEKFKKCCGK